MIFDELRKIRVNAFGTRSITLNKRWCLLNNINHGDQVRIIFGGTTCVIIPKNSKIYGGDTLEKFKKKLESDW